jgi:hypothetical protein
MQKNKNFPMLGTRICDNLTVKCAKITINLTYRQLALTKRRKLAPYHAPVPTLLVLLKHLKHCCSQDLLFTLRSTTTVLPTCKESGPFAGSSVDFPIRTSVPCFESESFKIKKPRRYWINA